MRVFKEIAFERPPLLLAAWPGMGNVGLIAMDYLRRMLDANTFAEINMAPYFIPESIVVKDGIAQFPDIPSSIFTYSLSAGVIIFESNVQIGGHEGLRIIRTILDFALDYKVERIFTAAAYAHSMTHTMDSEVMAACNTDTMIGEIARFNITPMPDGYIAGQNGLMLGVANTRSIPAACLLGTIPSYATNLAYPKASREIVNTFARILGIAIDMSEINESVAIMDRQLATIEERIRQFFPGNAEEHQDDELREVAEDKVPQYVMDRIEKLFAQVRNDRAQAAKLKEELDRWNLYELYENRFLDLFRD